MGKWVCFKTTLALQIGLNGYVEPHPHTVEPHTHTVEPHPHTVEPCNLIRAITDVHTIIIIR